MFGIGVATKTTLDVPFAALTRFFSSCSGIVGDMTCPGKYAGISRQYPLLSPSRDPIAPVMTTRQSDSSSSWSEDTDNRLSIRDLGLFTCTPGGLPGLTGWGGQDTYLGDDRDSGALLKRCMAFLSAEHIGLLYEVVADDIVQ